MSLSLGWTLVTAASIVSVAASATIAVHRRTHKQHTATQDNTSSGQHFDPSHYFNGFTITQPAGSYFGTSS